MSEDRMAFPDTWEEFEKEYGFKDVEEIYTNGSRLIQTFRVQQWLEHLQAAPYNEADELRDMLTNRLDYIAVLEAKCRDLTEKLHETELAVEHNRHLADEEQYKGELKYRDGVIYGLKYAIRRNGVSGGDAVPVKRGKWTNECACEFCGFRPWYERDIHTLNYCPNCGARMDEVNDG